LGAFKTNLSNYYHHFCLKNEASPAWVCFAFGTEVAGARFSTGFAPRDF
jgi:hypothetical protein